MSNFNFGSFDTGNSYRPTGQPYPHGSSTQPFNWRDYSVHLPYDYKEEHGDILIIYDEGQKDKALIMKEDINQMCIGQTKAIAVLMEDAAIEVSNHFDWLDKALQTHTYVFAFCSVTDDPIVKHKMQATYMASILDGYSKNNCFIPILTSAEQDSPLYLKVLKPIYMYNATWTSSVLKLLQCRIKSRLDREFEQNNRCRKYLEEKGILTPSSSTSEGGLAEDGQADRPIDSDTSDNDESVSLTDQRLPDQNISHNEIPLGSHSLNSPMIVGVLLLGFVSLVAFLIHRK